MKKLTQKEWIAVAAGLVLVITFFYFGLPLRFFSSSSALDTSEGAGTAVLSETVLDSGLVIKDVVVGTGERAREGQVLVVHYVGRLENGTQFDSSIPRGQPFAFVLGSGSVIAGWEEGLRGMQVGGKRILTIPSELGYGSQGTGNIPPHATLIFEVTLLDVADPSEF